jgi:hypothetical protein
VDASRFDGISFTLSGDAGEAQLELQVQTSHDYPIDDGNSKGECQGSWSDCVNNAAAIDFTSSAEVMTVQVPWADLTGGTPVSTMDPSEILGIQWQLNCASDAVCTPNIVIDDVQFYPPE